MPRYVPQKGDFVILTFDPQAGHEQKGRRPALVVSNTLFNRHTGLAMVCPITNTFRNIPFYFQTILQTARQQIRAGKGIPHDEFWREMESEPQ